MTADDTPAVPDTEDEREALRKLAIRERAESLTRPTGTTQTDQQDAALDRCECGHVRADHRDSNTTLCEIRMCGCGRFAQPDQQDGDER